MVDLRQSEHLSSPTLRSMRLRVSELSELLLSGNPSNSFSGLENVYGSLMVSEAEAERICF